MWDKLGFSSYDDVAKLKQKDHLFLAGGTADFIPYAFDRQHRIEEARICSYADTHGYDNLIRVYRTYEANYPYIGTENLLPTSGSTSALTASLLLIAKYTPEKEILIIGPCWSIYHKISELAGLKATQFLIQPLGCADDMRMRLESTIQRHRFSAVLLASPMNPTGVCLDAQTEELLLNITTRQGIYLIVDETYHGLQYNDRHSILDSTPSMNRLIVIRSLSKYYCMPGLRVGFVIAEADIATAIHEIVRAMYLSCSNLSQALATEMIGKIRYSDWHQYICKPKLVSLKQMMSVHASHMKLIEPDSAFFVCFRILMSDGTPVSSENLFKSTRIVARDCTDFGLKGYMRINLCCSDSTYRLFLSRLSSFLSSDTTFASVCPI